MENMFFNVKEFGAIGNGENYDTPSINNAIKHCYEVGGGVVLFPAGKYLISPIKLFSNVTLYLSSGAIIIASTNIEDYFLSHMSKESPRIGLIYAQDSENISILGNGTIDLKGMHFMNERELHIGQDFDKNCTFQKDKYLEFNGSIEDGPVKPLDRPGNLVQFLRCKNVNLKDFTLLDAPNWAVHFDECEDVNVSNLKIKNNKLIPNSDGIHITMSKNIKISDSYIESGDDCIAITGEGINIGKNNLKTENVVVSNCILSSRSSAIRVGYSDGTNIENCLFNNISIFESNRGIGIFQRDKGYIKNIIFSNLKIETRLHTGHWWGHGEPIHISSVPRSNQLGTIENVSFSNIMAKSETGILIYGCQSSPINNLNFDQINIEVVPSRLSERYGGNFDLRPVKDLTKAIFAHDEYGLYCQYTNGLVINKFNLIFSESLGEYFKKGVYLENIHNFEVSQMKVNKSNI